MADEHPEEASTSAQEDIAQEDKGIIGDLESLLEEEGMSLEEDEDKEDGPKSEEDELAALFEDEEEDDELPAAAPAPAADAAAGRKSRADMRSLRRDRRRDDADTFKDLDAQIQLSPTGIKISEDKLIATIDRITADDTLESILGLIVDQGITVGIEQENIRSSLAKARTGQIQYEVTVARGKPPKILKDTEIVYHFPDELSDEEGRTPPFERLKNLLDGPHGEAAKSWKGITQLVSKDEVIAELLPAQTQLGKGVCGDVINIAMPDNLKLEAGENTVLSEDGTKCMADLYGYVGLLADQPTVLSPIWVSEDHMEARFIFIRPPKDCPVPTEDELQELLEQKWIEFGLMDKQLALLRQRIANKKPLPASLPIAQGSPEISGEHAQIKYTFDPYAVMNWNQIQSLLNLTNPEAIAESLAQIREESPDIVCTAFHANDTVAEKIPATEGIMGTDIQGEEVVPEEGQDTIMEVGDNLTLSEDELRATANFFGFVFLQYDIQMILLPPIWMNADKTAAYYLNLPQGVAAKYPSLDDMQALLAQFEIKHGFSEERWVEMLARLEAGEFTDPLILIAEGISAQAGKDAEFEWAIPIEDRQPGKILDDGSIDFRERNLTTVVKENDLLGKLLPLQPGVPGKDIFGNEIEPPQPINIEVMTDPRIYADAVEGGMEFFAEIGGGISTETELKKVQGKTHKRINISIQPITEIAGDVDYSTGNIDFNGDVVIGGSVHSHFSVKATGSVTIGGYVEAGAYITAGTDILIKSGVVGANTELVAGGGVMAKYIQEASIRSGGDVKAGSYIFNASIRSGGKVLVPGKGEGKSRALVGGLIWGAQGIEARAIGSPYNTSTRLVTGIDPEQVNRAEQVRSNMQACEEKQKKMLKSISVDSLDLAVIKQRLSMCRSPKDRQNVLKTIKRIAKIAELEQHQQKEIEAIAEAQRKLATQVKIEVTNEIFAGVELRIGEEKQLLLEDHSKARFRLVKEEDELKIQMDNR